MNRVQSKKKGLNSKVIYIMFEYIQHFMIFKETDQVVSKNRGKRKAVNK